MKRVAVVANAYGHDGDRARTLLMRRFWRWRVLRLYVCGGRDVTHQPILLLEGFRHFAQCLRLPYIIRSSLPPTEAVELADR